MNRSIKTIAGRIIRKKGNSKMIVPNAIFHISVWFIVAISLIFFTFGIWWLSWFYHGDEAENIIFVNLPQSFKNFVEDENVKLESSFQYQWDAPYDYITFGNWMHDKNAYLAIVFPPDFDERMHNGEELDILTYYRTDSLEYMQGKDEIVDYGLEAYKNHIKTVSGIPVSSHEPMEIALDGVATSEEDIHSTSYFTKQIGRTFVPLVIFIMVLYMSMSSGTNVIAGEKEQGTFAAVLMTPVKRIHIVLGNIIGVTVKAFIPAAVFLLLVLLSPVYFSFNNIPGILVAFILLISLAVFVAAITILVSVLNDSVVSAQTTFLPIFLIIVAICVTCIQSISDVTGIYYFFPIYGHFYGLGNCITGNINILGAILCPLTSVIFAAICMFISEKLLHMERFTVSGDQISSKDLKRAKELAEKQSRDYISRPKATVFNFKGTKRTTLPGFLIDQTIYPLAVLSIFQMLALIPTVILYMRKPEYSQFIYSLKDVSTVPEVISKSFEVMTIFMSDPAFLVFMSLGYVGIIATYILRVKIRERGNSITLGFTRGNVFKKYLKGLLLGLVLMGGTYLLLIITGQLTPSLPEYTGSALLTIFAGLLMWLPQGAAEEVMFRGFMLPRQGARLGKTFALVFSSLLFAGFHSMNVGFSLLAFVNLFLIAFFFALMDWHEGHIWYSCAAHTMWNFLQGNVFGLQVSGNQGSPTLISANYTSNAKDIITGGSFGPEGGLAVTFVTSLAIVVLVIIMRRKKTPLQEK